jgi:hypothetical protein
LIKNRLLLKDQAKQSRKRARNQMMLMKSASEMTKNNEMKSDGLVILLARYGQRLNEEYDWGSNEDELRPNIDVTIQLNFFVNQSKLILKQGTKMDLLGFYNPSIGSKSRSDEIWAENENDEEDEDTHKNRLFIRYLFRGVQYEILFENEMEEIRLPHPDAVRVV